MNSIPVSEKEPESSNSPILYRPKPKKLCKSYNIFKNNLIVTEGAEIKVKDRNGNILNDSDLVGTGMRLEVTKGNSIIQLTIVVIGDLDGDGIVSLSDVTEVRSYMSLDRESQSLTNNSICDIILTMELKGKVIDFLGDSLTEGHGLNDDGNRYDRYIAKTCGLKNANN